MEQQEKSILMRIQDTVVNYADIVSQISRVDVEVVDDRLYRVAGTGIFSGRVNENMAAEGYVYKQVLKTGKPQIIYEPGREPICRSCPLCNKCYEEIEISMPVSMNGQILGVIGLVGTSLEQKKQILQNEKLYLDFLDQITQFILVKVREEVRQAHERALEETLACGDIIGSSPQMQHLKESIHRVSKGTSTVLITGESGTGKEMVARAIWKAGDRSAAPFVAINCAAIPENLLESELFGYVKGAFSGADPGGRMGKFELADHGILFLDEIGDMPLHLQVKLLRVLQERKIIRVGSNQVVPIDVRILAATNKDLWEMVQEGKFRQDLYYRLNVIPLRLVPLRERKGDIEELALFFARRYAKRLDRYFWRISDDAMERLKSDRWEGNVRELENVLEFMMNMVREDGVLNTCTLPERFDSCKEGRTERVSVGRAERSQRLSGIQEGIPMAAVIPLKELERQEIRKALSLYGVSTSGKKQAASRLGISLATLYRKLEEYGLS
ncbi:sigma 54-interacting transcriptional regulator [Anaerotruncus sp. 1XD42-93]|uniref:sigma-54 interaction domain-containing protein n=1 Tax=Anaerotruncus sp. 1XD42-93 TaxID=2320853 RepID=UPI000EA328D2|nr:sigma 54-interacting transcriptional regulator [Anaerotruncus sp. 1XD42-93]NBK20047.1 AAA family ATPase [Anaerotruncus sp. 1XD42-93]RKJ75470.1 AAA family ATPase [Anaerotruncus sp. 1XD22-93]